MFLQAYTDDSASESGDKRLFMCGYLARADAWALLSEAWDRELRSYPSVRYLKMSEAANLGGEFRGWSQEKKNAKLLRFARIIRHFDPLSFEFSISREDYYEHLRQVAPHGIRNPHFACCFGVVASVARYAAQGQVDIPIEFIFDEQKGVSSDISIFFAHMKESLSEEAKKLISGSPIFRDDKAVLPLQAADMLAWHIRREHEMGQEKGKVAMTNLLISQDVHLYSSLDKETIMHWSQAMEAIPGVRSLRSKSQWQQLRRNISKAAEMGYVIPRDDK